MHKRNNFVLPLPFSMMNQCELTHVLACTSSQQAYLPMANKQWTYTMIEMTDCSCYRFGKNMWKANLGSCFLQVQTTLVFIGVVRELFS
ncbi:Prolyl oligopeptidase family protein [Zea mays]|uniref:Prolyl oligopeptidase family protein n=2 Tax=Zea mays TaxID=4577 RepID=A0A1D6E3C5_MAIZE|nr:Prolyl oligopeptidase family protein [Zea mays]